MKFTKMDLRKVSIKDMQDVEIQAKDKIKEIYNDLNTLFNNALESAIATAGKVEDLFANEYANLKQIALKLEVKSNMKQTNLEDDNSTSNHVTKKSDNEDVVEV